MVLAARIAVDLTKVEALEMGVTYYSYGDLEFLVICQIQ